VNALEPSTLALFWAAVIALSILLYVILDGFDLGVGILFGANGDDSHRQRMIESIGPFWDGNATWLVIVGTGLFAAFPAVYVVFLGAFYLPVLFLMLGLIFRGIAFEFRHHGTRMRAWWDRGFFLGSAVAAFVQGAAIGAMIHGIPVEDGQYAGGPFLWLAPLPVLTGIGLVAGYALLGAAWLALKNEGELQSWAFSRIPWLAAAVLAILGAAMVFTFDYSDLVRGHWAERPWGRLFPALGLLSLLATVVSALNKRDVAPFICTVLFFISAYASLGVMFWPHMIPYSVTVASAAAPDASLRFLFYAGLVVLPVIALYTIGVYWLFRGKIRPAGIRGSDG